MRSRPEWQVIELSDLALAESGTSRRMEWCSILRGRSYQFDLLEDVVEGCPRLFGE